MSKIINFEDIKNKKFEKRHIVYLIFLIIMIYIFYSIYLLVKTPNETVTINSGVLTLEESATGYIIRNEQVLKGNNYKNGLTAIVSEGERAAKGQAIFRYSSTQENEIKLKIEELNLKIQDALSKQPTIFSTDIKNLDKEGYEVTATDPNKFAIECMECIDVDMDGWNKIEKCNECIFDHKCVKLKEKKE